MGTNFLKQKEVQKKKSNLGKPIKIEEATYFKENFGFNRAAVSISRRMGGNNELHYKNRKTNPQISLMGAMKTILQ